VLDRVASPAASALGRWAFARLTVAGRPARGARTGYTRSDRVELYVASSDLVALFEALLAEGEPLGLVPVGLGARDTLRLEAAMALYGHELDETTSPFEAGLGRYVKLARGGFIGAEAIARRHAAGETRTLVGFELLVPGIARAEHEVAHGGRTVGRVTSGAPSPTLGKSIGLAYVPPDLAAVGTSIDILIRGRACAARVVETPFVKTTPQPTGTGGQ
jgi:aminomethyltransferase